MDRISDQILQELSRDGRISNLDLAAAVGLSPSACLRRVQEMERRGIIRGYRARLDPEATGQAYVVYVAVGLAEHSKAAQLGFEQAMRAAPEVTECHNIAGAFEYLLRVETRDLPALLPGQAEADNVGGEIDAVFFKRLADFANVGAAGFDPVCDQHDGRAVLRVAQAFRRIAHRIAQRSLAKKLHAAHPVGDFTGCPWGRRHHQFDCPTPRSLFR